MDGRVLERDLDPEFDEHAWLLEQARVLRAQRLNAVDTQNLAEFLESMAKKEVREVVSQIERLFMHILKFTVQPERATRSWAISVTGAQNKLQGLLESATLRQAAEARLPQAWERARRAAAAETSLPLSVMPVSNPLTLDSALAWVPPSDLPTRNRQ